MTFRNITPSNVTNMILIKLSFSSEGTYESSPTSVTCIGTM